MTHRTRVLVCVWFAVLLVVPAVATLLVRRQTVDNRELTSFPTIDIDGLLYGDVPEGVDAYLEDRLSVRELAVEADARVAIDLFDDSPNPNVLLGDDGWLFTAAAFTMVCEPDWPEVDDVTRQLRRLEANLGQHDASLTTMIVPEKGWAYPERLPAAVPDEECADRRLTELRDELVTTDHYFDLWSHVQTEVAASPDPLYWRTDTHWNDPGRVVILPHLIEWLEPGVFDPDAAVVAGVNVTDGGDLAAQVGVDMPDQSPNYVIQRPRATTRTEPLVPGLVNRHITEGADPVIEGKTLILTDSHLYNSASLLAPWFEDVVILRWQHQRRVDLDALVDDADQVAISFSGRFSGPRFERAGRDLTRLLRN
ncbi:MAG: alginate O-acetyltransferase AlgX-related protein [Acidimicrobiales bacterium]